MKKTWEREALIKELHDKEFTESENEAKAKGYKTDISELKGYPIETLNNPEVQSLKNGYQNAFSQYISGFLAEASGDVGNAAAGYRTAIELQPNLISIKQHLADLDARMTQKNTKTVQTITEEKNVKTESKYKKVKDKKKSHSESKEQNSHLTSSSTLQNLQAPINNQSDVLIVVENGISPKRTGITIPLPIPSAGLVPISFPLLENEPISANKAISIRLPDNTITNLDLITSIDAMARRSLKDHLPYIMVRAAIRGAIKGAAQAVAYKENTFAGLAVNAINIATEQADERIWKLLPADILIARVHLPEGSHSIKLLMSDGEHSVDIKVSGKYSVVPIRVVGQAIYTL